MKEFVKKHWMWIVLAIVVIAIVYHKKDQLSSMFGTDNYSGPKKKNHGQLEKESHGGIGEGMVNKMHHHPKQ